MGTFALWSLALRECETTMVMKRLLTYRNNSFSPYHANRGAFSLQLVLAILHLLAAVFVQDMRAPKLRFVCSCANETCSTEWHTACAKWGSPRLLFPPYLLPVIPFPAISDWLLFLCLPETFGTVGLAHDIINVTPCIMQLLGEPHLCSCAYGKLLWSGTYMHALAIGFSKLIAHLFTHIRHSVEHSTVNPVINSSRSSSYMTFDWQCEPQHLSTVRPNLAGGAVRAVGD